MFDVIIIGAGPGGLGAGLYTSRGGFETLILEGMFIGGQAATTYEVDNYLGFDETPSGSDLTEKMRSHAQKFGAQIQSETVEELSLEGKIKTVRTNRQTYETKTVIFAMGAKPRPLGAEGEERLRGMGVSYCATCDGAFFRGREVCVVGGGDTALEDALFLEKFCSRVTLIHRRDSFRAIKVLQNRVVNSDKINILYDSTVTKITGDDSVNGVEIKNLKSGASTELAVSGIFIAVGNLPQSELVRGLVKTDEAGYIVTDENMCTSIPGVFACGDVRKKPLRQIVTAVADGAVAAYSAQNYMLENEF